MLTNEQLEKAAREYCKLEGTNPDEKVIYADKSNPTLAKYDPYWKTIVQQIKRVNEIQELIDWVKKECP